MVKHISRNSAEHRTWSIFVLLLASAKGSGGIGRDARVVNVRVGVGNGVGVVVVLGVDAGLREGVDWLVGGQSRSNAHSKCWLVGPIVAS